MTIVLIETHRLLRKSNAFTNILWSTAKLHYGPSILLIRQEYNGQPSHFSYQRKTFRYNTGGNIEERCDGEIKRQVCQKLDLIT